MMATLVTADEAACLIAGNALAKSTWRRWREHEVDPLTACLAIAYMAEELLDTRSEVRERMREALQLAIDQERTP